MAENKSVNQKPRRPGPRKPRLKLPFDNRRQDIGSWGYDNRRGLSVLLVMAFLLTALLLGYRISVMPDLSSQVITVDLTDQLSELIEQKEQLEREIEEKLSADDMSDVRNLTSNESAEERERRIYDARNAQQMEEINAEARRVMEGMEANRRRFEQGVDRQNEIMNQPSSSSSADQSASDTKVKGRVTVSYSFRNPVRTAQYLDIPAYRCERGGEIVVVVTLNHNGDVVATNVDEARSSGDDCMRETALRAARRSRFNIDTSAPEKHTGTITYIFIPQ